MAYPGTAVPRDSWIGVLVANAEQYLPGVVELIYRDRLLLAMMRKKGRFVFNKTGDQFTWLLKNKLPTPVGFNDYDEPTFNRRERHKQASLNWKSWMISESLSWHNMQQNRSPAKLVDLGDDVLKSLGEGVRNYFGAQCYENGADDSSDNILTGFEAMSGTGTATSTDLVADPAGTYAGISQAIDDTATWSDDRATPPNATIAKDWPLGTGAEHYDYWSPLLINYASTGWGLGSVSWRDNCLKVLRNMKAWQQRRCGSKNYKLDLFLTDTEMETDLKDKLEQRFRVVEPHTEGDSLGFPGTVNYEGLMVSSEYNCPTGVGYLLPVDGLSVMCVTPDLFVSEGPEWLTQYQKFVWLLKTMLNMRIESPKFMCKVADFT